VTHRSLVANQRPHISLIDRRHTRLRRVAHQAFWKPHTAPEAANFAHPLTALSHINV
jgi:hypothetical protein